MENDFKYYRNSQMKTVSLRSRERNEEITNNTKPVLKIEKENGVRGTVATWQSIIVLRYFLSLRRM